MEKLFLSVLNMSITASYVILFVMLVRLLLKKAPKLFSYALWGVVLVRLVCPFSITGVFSLIPISTQTVPQDIMYQQSPRIDSGIVMLDRAISGSLPAPMPGASMNPLQLWITLWAAVWLCGLVVLLLYSVLTTIRLAFRLKASKPVSGNIYEMNGIKSPFVFGFFRPKIYLPQSLIANERDYILTHEQTHIKRFDHIIKPCAFLVLCVHWFNPLVWVAFFLMGEDMEFSCDESVIKQLGSDIKKDYSTSLLSLSTGRRIIGGCPLAFGENNTKGRIKNILHYKKPAFWVIILVAVVLTWVAIGLMGSPPSAAAIGVIGGSNNDPASAAPPVSDAPPLPTDLTTSHSESSPIVWVDKAFPVPAMDAEQQLYNDNYVRPLLLTRLLWENWGEGDYAAISPDPLDDPQADYLMLAFEDITGMEKMRELFSTYSFNLPAQVVEEVLLTRFPFTADQLHEILAFYYRPEEKTYYYESGRGGGPIECAVTSVKDNGNGTVVLEYVTLVGYYDEGSTPEQEAYLYKRHGTLTLKQLNDGSYRYWSVRAGLEEEARPE